MEFIRNILMTQDTLQAITVISIVSLIGLYLGKLKIGGISLGITFVFFTGIIAAHFRIRLNPDILAYIQNFGLVIFVYTLGLEVGPGFFSSLRKGGIKLNALSLGLVAADMLFTLMLFWALGMPLSDLMGLLSGATTNTPMLGAAQQAFLQIHPGDDAGAAGMALACAVAYPLGVVGMVLAIIVLKWLSPKKALMNESSDKADNTYAGEFHVSNPAIFNKSIQEVMQLTDRHFVISRIWRNGKVSIPTSKTLLQPGDHLLAISGKEDVEIVKAMFGEQENVDWNKQDIDWNAIDSHMVSRHVYVTKDKMNGVKLGSLKLRNAYGINITRVNRAGITLVASPDLRLQTGDRLTIVGDAKAIDNVGAILGNEEKQLNNPNLTTIFIGLAIGVILGAIPIHIPGMSLPVRLGIAGGPIITGILMGAFGPRLHIITYTTRSANLMMRQFGIVTYLAGLGLASGAEFFTTLFSMEGLKWVGIGFIMTTVPALTIGMIATRLCRVSYPVNVGMLCGSMANPMALNYANTIIEGDEPSVSYATVYPLAMFLRVILAQLIITLFC